MPMFISSRTPDGTPNHCPVCNSDIRIDPSSSSVDAPCPNCGTLLWFISDQSGLRFYPLEFVKPIQDSVEHLVCDKFRFSKEQIGNSGSFLGDLQADSLDTVELVMALEGKFDLSISEDDLRKMKTIGDITNYIIQNEL